MKKVSELKLEDKFPDFMVLTTNRSVLDGDLELSGVKLSRVTGVGIAIGSSIIDIPYTYLESVECLLIEKKDIIASLSGLKLGIFFLILRDDMGWLPVGPFLGEKYHGDNGTTQGS